MTSTEKNANSESLRKMEINQLAEEGVQIDEAGSDRRRTKRLQEDLAEEANQKTQSAQSEVGSQAPVVPKAETQDQSTGYDYGIAP